MDYLYWIPSTDEDRDLAYLEASVLLEKEVNESIVISKKYVDIKNAAFLKLCGKVLCQADSISKLLIEVEERNFDYDKFKIIVHKTKYQKKENINRLDAVISFADAIENGFPDLSNPKVFLDILSDGSCWYFLERKCKSENSWSLHIHKPQNFSSSLSARYCRALVNIALPNGGSLLDPCCGYGNVLVEASYLGINSFGNDWNKDHYNCTKINLEHFHLSAKVSCQDALKLVVGDVDAIIVDYPYNINSLTPNTFYQQLAEYFFNKTKVFLCLTVEPLEEILTPIGYKVKNVAIPHKGEFKRYVTLCEV